MGIASKTLWAGVGATLCLLCATLAFAADKRQRDLPLPIKMRFTPPFSCKINFADQAFSLPDDEDQMVTALQKLRRDWKSVTILSEGEAPYRCIGHAIFIVQRAGFTRIDFAEQPLKQ